MALSSMTGFAQHAGSADGVAWTWELRSVNGKSLDVRFRMPSGCEALEVPARSIIAQHLKRGNVQASLSISGVQPGAGVVINEAVLAQLAVEAEKLRMRFGGPPISAEGLLSLRGVVEPVQQTAAGPDLAKYGDALLASFGAAAEALDVERRGEGARLHDVISGQLDRIAELTRQARDCPARAPEAVKARLKELLAKLLEPGMGFDPDRLHQEAVVLATRSDIQEEIDRLFSHVESARALMASGEPAGRKFEFLSQEFNREANTLCSKSSDRSMTAIGLELKTVIDQLREQVQNIE
jgi:uncharacterized protein (TIGR00255 family)